MDRTCKRAASMGLCYHKPFCHVACTKEPNTEKYQTPEITFDVAWSWRCSEAPSLAQGNRSFGSWGFPLNTYFQENKKQPFHFHLPLSFSLFLDRSKLWLFPSFKSVAISHDHWLFLQISSFSNSPFCVYSSNSETVSALSTPCIFQSTSQLQTFRIIDS